MNVLNGTNVRITFAALALALAGCTADSNFLEVNQARSFAVDCSTDSALYIPAGSVNLGWTNSYLAFFSVANHMAPTTLSVSGQQLNTQDQNDVLISSYHIQYATTPTLSIPEADFPVLEVIPVGATVGDTYLAAQLLSTPAVSALAGAGSTQVLATITFKGKTVGGIGVSTNPVVFPFSTFSTTRPSCPLASAPTLTVEEISGGCYNPGQDGQTINCVAP